MSQLGCYYAPAHDRPDDFDYMRRLDPPVVRILMPGDAPTNLVSHVHQTVPNARIALRWWDVDDGGESNKRGKLNNPEASAERDGKVYLSRIVQMETEAKQHGLPFPARKALFVNALNEPPTWEHNLRSSIVAYNRTLILTMLPHGVPTLALCLAVGHPEEWPPVWDLAKPVIDTLKLSPYNALELHEYWQLEGPEYVWSDAQGSVRNDWGALAGRYQHCPFDVPILIGECGADGRLYDRKPRHTGWRGNMSADAYAAQIGTYLSHTRQDKRIIGALPFLTDYQDGESWASFDTGEAHGAILQMVAQQATTYTVNIPGIVTTDNQPKPPTFPPVDSEWARSRAFIRQWEGGYQNIPNDVGNWTGGAVGVGQNKGTKYGISAASYPHLDIINLTPEQADAIYYTDYWQASGADRLPYPLSLLVLDTAVLHGVGTARKWLEETGPDAFAFAAKRLGVYTKMPNWDTWGRGWVNRVADLLTTIGEGE